MNSIFYLSIIFIFAKYVKPFFPGTVISNLMITEKDRTHGEMTLCAFYQITFEYLESEYENVVRNYHLPPTQNGRCSERESVMINLFKNLNIKFKFIKKALEKITDLNQYTDTDEQFNEEAHFDSETFEEGAKRLLLLKAGAIYAIKLGYSPQSRSFLGRLLHTLQDFYSHSNWVESISSEKPNEFLANSNDLGSIVDKNTVVCIDCDSNDNCKNNINPVLSEQKLLTSGFFSMSSKEKPFGKCSHGGWFDKTRKNSYDGINKDKLSSPHGNLHYKAANLAEISTYKFFYDLRKEIGDVYFGQILGFNGNTIALIFETNDLLGKKIKVAENIFKKYESGSSFHNFIFSTSNIKLLKADNLNKFLKKIENPQQEYFKTSFSKRIINVLKFCEQNSIVYIHANILLSNIDLSDEIIPLAEENNIIVNIVFDLSDNAYAPTKLDNELTKLAKVTGGSVWYLNDIEGLLSLINVDIQIDNLQTILIVDNDEKKDKEFDKVFYIDSTIEEYYVSISPKIEGWIENPSNEKMDLDSKSNVTKQIKFDKPIHGEWRINIKAKGFSLRISAISKVLIKSNLYSNDDSSEELTKMLKIPIVGQNLTIITVVDKELEIDEVYYEILSKASDLFSTHISYKYENNLYSTWFLVPEKEFRIKFYGVNQKTQEIIERYENDMFIPSNIGIYINKNIQKSYIIPGQNYNLTYRIKYYLKDEIILKLVIQDTLDLIYYEKSLRIVNEQNITESLKFTIPSSASSLEGQVNTIIVSVFEAFTNLNEPVNYDTTYVTLIPDDFFSISPNKNRINNLKFLTIPQVYITLIMIVVVIFVVVIFVVVIIIICVKFKQAISCAFEKMYKKVTSVCKKIENDDIEKLRRRELTEVSKKNYDNDETIALTNNEIKQE